MSNKYTNNEWNALMREWESSGETRNAFCRRKGIKFVSFRNRRYELMREARRDSEGPSQTESPGKLLPVRVAEAPVAPPAPIPDLFLQFPSGVCLRFVVGTSVDYLSRLSFAMVGRSAC